MENQEGHNAGLGSFGDKDQDIVFSIMKDGGPTEGVFQLSATPGPVVTFPEEGEVEVVVVIEDGEEEQAGFLKLDSQDHEVEREENGDLQASFYSFWWTIRRGGTEIHRFNNTGSYKFNVASRDQISFSLDGSRGSKRAVLSYLFAAKRNSFGPGDGGSAAVTVSNLSSTITSGTRILRADFQANSLGTPRDTRWLDYKWQYAESGSDTWVDLPNAGNFDYIGARSRVLYLSRNYVSNNFARRYRVVTSSSYYAMDPVISQEVPGLPGPIVELPGRPRILSVEPDNSLVNLSWSDAFNGFATITDYVVEYAAYHPFLPLNWIRASVVPSSSSSSSSATPTTATVTGLSNGTGYTFRVSAVNSVGQGQPSTQSNLAFGYVVPGIIPDPPVLLTVTAGVGLVSLDWEPAPSYSGSSYFIEISTNNGTSWARISSGNTEDWPLNATNATLRNLTGGTEYSLRVLALGTSSKPSNPSNVIKATPTAAAPYPPVNLRVIAYYSDRSVPNDFLAEENLALSWEDDPRYPGTPPTGKVAQYSLDGGETWNSISSNVSGSSYDVEIVNFPSFIPRNTEFLFRAATINAVGQSEWSEPKAGTTSADSVEYVLVNRGDSSATLNWNAPSGGNASIVDYAVWVREGGKLNGDLYSVQTGQRISGNTNPGSIDLSKLTDTSAVVNNLTAGKLYFFHVRAINTGQTNNSPHYLGALTGLGKPRVIQFFDAFQGRTMERGVEVSITPYASTPPSAPLNAPTAVAGIPGVVMTPVPNRDADSVSLSWTIPTTTAVVLEITGYAIQYSGDDGLTWNNAPYLDPRNGGSAIYYGSLEMEMRPLNPPASTTMKVQGLTLMQPYVFRVAAINEIGAGPYSPASAPVTPTKLPLGPEGVVATAGNGSVSLSWTARTVDSERLPVIGYNVWYQTSSYWSNVINNTGTYNPPGPWIKFNGNTLITGTSAVVTGLTNGRSYNFHVYAVNAGGQGSPSDPMLTRTPTATGPSFISNTSSAPSSSSSSLGPLSAPANLVAGELMNVTSGGVTKRVFNLTWNEPAPSGSYFVSSRTIEINQTGYGDTWVVPAHQMNELGGQAEVLVGLNGTLYHPIGAYQVRVRLSYNNSSSGPGWSAYSITSVFIN